MLREGRKEWKKDMKDSEKARSSTTECVLTTSIWRHQHRLSCYIHAPARYVLGIRETLAARVVRRVQQSAFLRRSRFVSCLRTQVHATSCFYCSHMSACGMQAYATGQRASFDLPDARKFMTRLRLPGTLLCNRHSASTR